MQGYIKSWVLFIFLKKVGGVRDLKTPRAGSLLSKVSRFCSLPSTL